MRYKKTKLSFLLTILLLTACSSYESFKIESDVVEVKVSSFEDFGNINENYEDIFEYDKDVQVFVDAVNTSKPLKGDVDMPEGTYDFLFILKEGASEGFHLWISEDLSTGTIMNMNDTATAYKLTEKSTDKIKSLLTN